MSLFPLDKEVNNSNQSTTYPCANCLKLDTKLWCNSCCRQYKADKRLSMIIVTHASYQDYTRLYNYIMSVHSTGKLILPGFIYNIQISEAHASFLNTYIYSPQIMNERDYILATKIPTMLGLKRIDNGIDLNNCLPSWFALWRMDYIKKQKIYRKKSSLKKPHYVTNTY